MGTGGCASKYVLGIATGCWLGDEPRAADPTTRRCEQREIHPRPGSCVWFTAASCIGTCVSLIACVREAVKEGRARDQAVGSLRLPSADRGLCVIRSSVLTGPSSCGLHAGGVPAALHAVLPSQPRSIASPGIAMRYRRYRHRGWARHIGDTRICSLWGVESHCRALEGVRSP